MNVKELREKRANLIHQAGELLKRAENEKRELSSEEDQQWTNLHKEADDIKRNYERMERQQDLESEMRESQGHVGIQSAEDRDVTDEERREAFGNWLRFGMSGLSPEHRAIMSRQTSSLPKEARAQSVGVDTSGGYLVDSEMVKKIETAMLPYSGVRNTRATIIRTQSGADMPMPTSNDTDNEGERLGENSQAGSQDIEFGSKTLRAYMYSSKIVRVSLQFLQDSSIPDIEGWLTDRLAERIGRKTGDDFITGTGNNEPEGLASGATLGVTAASDSAITYDELVDLEHSVNASYRRQAEFLLADGALKAIKKLKDGEGRPLWVPGVAVKEPDTILGYKYAVDENIPTPAASAISAYFGDFSKFHIRDVLSMQILRLSERYADYLQVGFLLFSRHDAILLDAGTNPIAYLQMHA